MRLCTLLLALSTLTAAGPLPLFSNAGLVARTSSSVGATTSVQQQISDTESLQAPANHTLGLDAVAALAQLEALKAVYDSRNQTEPSSTLKVKRDFWQWIKDAFEAPGLKARSPIPTPVSLLSRVVE